MMFDGRCLWFVVCCLVFAVRCCGVVRCLLVVVWCSFLCSLLFGVRCVRCVVGCVQLVVDWCSLFVVRCVWFGVLVFGV